MKGENYYSQCYLNGLFPIIHRIFDFCRPLQQNVWCFLLRYFALHPRKEKLVTPPDNVGFRKGTLLCRVSMNMCLVALSEQHALFQCFPRRHALATAHNATTPSEAKHASQVSAIRECLYGKHMKSVAWCEFREGKVRLSANEFAESRARPR